MLYNLKNGRTIDISIEQALDMTDEDLQFLNAYGYGEIIENPFHSSVLHNRPVNPDEIPEIEDLTEEIPDINDLDIDPTLLEE